MLYNSFVYLLPFLGLTVALYYLSPLKHRWKVLLAFSIIFFMIASGWLILLLLFTAFTVYTGGIRIENDLESFENIRAGMDRKERKEYKKAMTSRHRRWIGLIVVVNLLLLFTHQLGLLIKLLLAGNQRRVAKLQLGFLLGKLRLLLGKLRLGIRQRLPGGIKLRLLRGNIQSLGFQRLTGGIKFRLLRGNIQSLGFQRRLKIRQCQRLGLNLRFPLGERFLCLVQLLLRFDPGRLFRQTVIVILLRLHQADRHDQDKQKEQTAHHIRIGPPYVMAALIVHFSAVNDLHE